MDKSELDKMIDNASKEMPENPSDAFKQVILSLSRLLKLFTVIEGMRNEVNDGKRTSARILTKLMGGVACEVVKMFDVYSMASSVCAIIPGGSEDGARGLQASACGIGGYTGQEGSRMLNNVAKGLLSSTNHNMALVTRIIMEISELPKDMDATDWNKSVLEAIKKATSELKKKIKCVKTETYDPNFEEKHE